MTKSRTQSAERSCPVPTDCCPAPCQSWCDAGLMCEVLWSDPGPNKGRMPSKRGVGVQFGADVTKRFLQDNSLGGWVGG